VRATILRLWMLAASACTAAATPFCAIADPVADFYQTHPITIVVGFPPSGGYDASARILALHMRKHIPGTPNIIVQNMPGAGSLVAANNVYNSLPRDGTVIGIFADAAPLAPLWKIKGALYDPAAINWLGSMASRGTGIALVRSDTPIRTIDDARKREVLVGATGPNDSSSLYPRMLNDLAGTKFRIVQGYRGGPEVDLAIERGELEGRLGTSWLFLNHDRPDWVKTGFVRIILQLSLVHNPALADVPIVTDLAANDEDRQIMQLIFGVHRFLRVFSLAPGVPADRLQALRAAFDKTMTDPAFIADSQAKLAEPLEVASWQEVTGYVRAAYATPAAVVERTARMMESEN
jgi:tripartite-type tricarboxylate transporter receptor subunit TctC